MHKKNEQVAQTGGGETTSLCSFGEHPCEYRGSL